MTDEDGRVSIPPFPPEYRASGVLLHIASLPSPYGIGDLGPAARAWVDRLRESGQSWWQALPLGPTGYGNSPYQSLSSFAGNELLISPDGLIEDGLLQTGDCNGNSFPTAAIDYGAVIPFKRRILEKAWSNSRAGEREDLQSVYEQFCNTHRHWLDDYALFRALKARHSDAYYLQWPAELVRRVPEALARARQELASQIDHRHFHRPHHPSCDHVRGRPVFWPDPGVEPLRNDVARRRIGVDFELDVGKGRQKAVPRRGR
jgi:4-alpha-glucanotransferase